MANVFQPLPGMTEWVPASKPHQTGTMYRVALGTELWGKQRVTVFKVQMFYEKVYGRHSPSYPADSDDAERVAAAIKKLKQIAMVENG